MVAQSLRQKSYNERPVVRAQTAATHRSVKNTIIEGSAAKTTRSSPDVKPWTKDLSRHDAPAKTNDQWPMANGQWGFENLYRIHA